MMLQAAEVVTAPDTTGWPWWGVLILFVVTVAAAVFGTVKVSKAKAKRSLVDDELVITDEDLPPRESATKTIGKPLSGVVLAALASLSLSGCALVDGLFSQAEIDRDLAAQNLRNWQTFDKHLSDPDVLSPGWVMTAKLLTTDATDTAQRLNDKAQPKE